MKKKKILFIYPSMMMGGSTTAMLSFMNSLDTTRYSIDLQLFRNEGPLLDMLPDYVNLLPEAQMYVGDRGKIIKLWKFLLSGYLFKALYRGLCNKRLISNEIVSDFSTKLLSHSNKEKYDYAIGYLEGWSDRYLAWKVCAEHKYAWIHSTFANITQDFKVELAWMREVDKIIFVTDACKNDFVNSVPEMKDKATVVENIIDSSIIRARSSVIDVQDREYLYFESSPYFKLVTVCRLEMYTKGIDRIISAAKILDQRGEKFLWYIIGAGEDESCLKERIMELGIEDKVVLIGARKNPYPFIKVSDVMCMPSRYEGKPLAVTESMILGVPPLVTKYLSACDQIKNGIEGIVVDNEDDAIIEAIQYCMDNKKELEKMQHWLSEHEYGNSEDIQIIEKKLLR